MDSGSNKRPLLCNKIRFSYTKQFNRGLSTQKLSENENFKKYLLKLEKFKKNELSNNELNLELFPIYFDDGSRAILDLPFTLGNNSLKLLNKIDGKIVDFTSSLNHLFLPKKNKIFYGT